MKYLFNMNKKIKILEAYQIGHGLLIENDGFVTNSKSDSNLLEASTFSTEGDQPVLIDCILQRHGVENKNGRIYPKEILEREVIEYGKEVETGASIGERNHPDCVQTEGSQILTSNGWKYFSEITDDEIIYTLDNTNKIVLQKIDKKIEQDYKGIMYKFYSKNSIDITVTPNHEFLLEDRSGNRFKMPAKEIYENVGNVYSSGKYKILKTGEWDGINYEKITIKGVTNVELPFNTPTDRRKRYTEDIDINAEDFFAFMGIYLSEGHSCGTVVGYKNRGYAIAITQKKEENKIKIEELLNKLPFKYTTNTVSGGKTQYTINDARLYNYLYKLGTSSEKYIPEELKLANKQLLNILFKWFHIGDGRLINTKYRKEHLSVFSTSKRLMEDMKEVLLKIGYSGNITEYTPIDRKIIDKKILVNSLGEEEIVLSERIILAENSKKQYNLNLSKTKHIWLDDRFISINKIDFDGKVSCVNVPNGNFYVMNNGKSHWTGNSSNISLGNIPHIVRKMWWKGNTLYGTLEIITSPGYRKSGIVSMAGDEICELIKRGIKLGISSRGVGSVKEENGKTIVQEDFKLICFDLVANPSTHGANLFPKGIKESFSHKNNKKIITKTQNTKNILKNFIKK